MDTEVSNYSHNTFYIHLFVIPSSLYCLLYCIIVYDSNSVTYRNICNNNCYGDTKTLILYEHFQQIKIMLFKQEQSLRFFCHTFSNSQLSTKVTASVQNLPIIFSELLYFLDWICCYKYLLYQTKIQCQKLLFFNRFLESKFKYHILTDWI